MTFFPQVQPSQGILIQLQKHYSLNFLPLCISCSYHSRCGYYYPRNVNVCSFDLASALLRLVNLVLGKVCSELRDQAKRKPVSSSARSTPLAKASL